MKRCPPGRLLPAVDLQRIDDAELQMLASAAVNPILPEELQTDAPNSEPKTVIKLGVAICKFGGKTEDNEGLSNERTLEKEPTAPCPTDITK
jgi:hypothetical protein